jgi:hypothetical protein
VKNAVENLARYVVGPEGIECEEKNLVIQYVRQGKKEREES